MSKKKMKPKAFDGQGQAVPLGAELGRGGEGIVFEIGGQPDHAAKIYHRPLDPERVSKLEIMVSLRSERLMNLSTWPLEVLLGEARQPIGFVMRRVTDFKNVHLLYSPKSRPDKFPHADWRFLVRAARNAASAFSVVHDYGLVIGDVNHANVVVASNALVKLIDCDSFQVSSRGRQFLCEGGVGEYTPPELQGRSLRGVTRTPNHDSFGLAVLVFHLLFLGRHPFVGRPIGHGHDLTLEQAIATFCFAYGRNAATCQVSPPPCSLSMSALPSSMGDLFERAFSQSGASANGRPTAREWVAGLDTLSKSIIQCGRNTSHYYPRVAGTCPWCDIEMRCGVLLFMIALAPATRGAPVFNLNAVWSQIVAIQGAGPPPPVPDPAKLRAHPTPWAQETTRRRRRVQGFAVGQGVIVLVLIFALSIGGGGAFWLLVGSIVVGAGVWQIGGDDARQARQRAETELSQARKQWADVTRRWHEDAVGHQFAERRRALDQTKLEYEGLPAAKQARLRRLNDERRQQQLYRFLDRHLIAPGNIKGIGPSRVATLASFGIESAADITSAALDGVPGFGPVLKAGLLDWRRRIESRFVFNPALGVDPADIAAVEREFATTGQRLKADLQNGPHVLRQTVDRIVLARNTLGPALERAATALAEAEANRRVLSLI